MVGPLLPPGQSADWVTHVYSRRSRPSEALLGHSADASIPQVGVERRQRVRVYRRVALTLGSLMAVLLAGGANWKSP